MRMVFGLCAALLFTLTATPPAQAGKKRLQASIDDTLHGGGGNDVPVGGGGSDDLDGTGGTDSCSQGESVKNCEG